MGCPPKNTNKNRFLPLGVDFDGKLYRARIRLNGKKIHLGYFKTAEKAHEAYLKVKRNIKMFREIIDPIKGLKKCPQCKNKIIQDIFQLPIEEKRNRWTIN